MYQLIDSGNGQKWEQFGPYKLCRPAPQALWRPQTKEPHADYSFSRDKRWEGAGAIPKEWEIELEGVRLLIAPTDFGHLGVFPEHASLWQWLRAQMTPKQRVLNLFAYSGGATMVAAQQGAEVCHLDASKGMVDWAKKNARLNHLSEAPIRWIVDDVLKFLKREIRRESRYEGIILDPPTFGRGAKGEVFKVEEMMMELLTLCKSVSSSQLKFVLLTCHTPGVTPTVLEQLLLQVFGKQAESGEMLLKSPSGFSIPSGSFARISF